MSQFSLKRRDALRLGGVAALAGTAGPALVGCSGSSRDDVGNKGKDLAPFPTYVPFDGPEPDLPGDEQSGLQAAYLKYPKEIVDTEWETPGDGSEVTASIITYGVPPKDGDGYVKAINDALGIKLKLELIPANEFEEKMAAMTTSEDIPDLIMFTAAETIPKEHEFIQATCADLSDLISGDNVKDYPGLANIPTYAWRGVGRISGKLYGIPTERPVFGGCLMVNRTEFDSLDVPVEWDQDGYLQALADYTKKKKYGLGLSNDFWIDYWAGSLGAPNEWKVKKDGSFATTYDTDEFKAAVELLAKQFNDGHVYPDSPNIPNLDNKTHFANTTVAAYRDGWGGMGPTAFLDAKDDFSVEFALPFSDKATPWAGPGYFGYTVMKKAKKDRLKMLLRVCDYLSAPFGTKQYELFNYGVEDEHFTRGDGGVPEPTKLWDKENKTNYPITYLAGAPIPLFYAGFPDEVEKVYEWEKVVAESTIRNPADGLRSAAMTDKYSELRKTIEDGLMDVIFRGKDMSSFDDVVKKWHDKGGDDVAAELAEEYEATEDD